MGNRSSAQDIWQSHIAKPYGRAIWQSNMAAAAAYVFNCDGKLFQEFYPWKSDMSNIQNA